MKKIFVIASLLVFVLSACVPGLGQVQVSEAQPTQSAVPTESPADVILHLCEIANVATGETIEVNGKTYSCETGKEVEPTESATPIPQASPIPATFTSTPLPTLAPVSVCGKHGTVAWQNDNMSSGDTYGLAPVGGLDESCWVVGQTHWKEADANGNFVEVRAVFAVAPHMVAWLKGYLGGTGWYFGGSEADVRANLAEQASQLEERDGKMKTYVIILPQDADSFPILDHVQTK